MWALILAAETEHIPVRLLEAICYVESKNNVEAIHYDDGGSPSYGMCQVKMETAQWLGYQGQALDLWKHPLVNATYAARYINRLLKRYAGDYSKTISAYNSGSYTTRNKDYVRKVLERLRKNHARK